MAQNQIAGSFLGNMDRNLTMNPLNYGAHSAWHSSRNDAMGYLGEIPPVWPNGTIHSHNKEHGVHGEKESLRASTLPLATHYKTAHDLHYAHYSHGTYNPHPRLVNAENGYLVSNATPIQTNVRRDQGSLSDSTIPKGVEAPSNINSSSTTHHSKDLEQPNVSTDHSVQRSSHVADTNNPSHNLSCSTSEQESRGSVDESGGNNQKDAPTAAHWKDFLSGLRTGHYEMSDTFRHHLDPETPVLLPEDYGKSDDESDTEQQQDKTPKQAKRSKVLEAKEALNRGQEHVNAKGKLIRARKMGDGCAAKSCRFKCEERITKEARSNIFNYFWNLGNHQLQWLFIAMHTSVRAPKQRTQDPIRSRRKTSRSYFFRQGTGKIPVCKTMFLHTLDVSDSWVDTAISKASNGVVVAPDCRGRHSKTLNDGEINSNVAEESVKKKKRPKKLKVFAEALSSAVECPPSENVPDVQLPLQNIENRCEQETDTLKSSVVSGPKELDSSHLSRPVNDNIDGRLYMSHTTSVEAKSLYGSHVSNNVGYPGNPHLEGGRHPPSDLDVLGVGPNALLRLPGGLPGGLPDGAWGDNGALPDRVPDAPSAATPPPRPRKRKRADVSAALGAAATGMGVGVGGILGAASVPEAFRHHLNPETLGLRELPNGAVVAPVLEDDPGAACRASGKRTARQREPARWRANLCKEALNTGKEHVNLKGKLIRARRLGEGCVDSCRFRCRDRIAHEDRESIFKHFWSLGDHQLQWLFISRHTRVREPKHRTTNQDPELSRRKTTRSYFFTVFRDGGAKRGYDVELEIPVCKTMFLRTLDVSDSWVESAIAKVHKAQHKAGAEDPDDDGVVLDRRGRHRKATRRIPEDIVESVRQHSRLFPRSGIPPNVKGFQRQCLADGLSVSKMHRMYLEWVQQQHPPTETASLATLRQYRDILAAELRAEFNIAKQERFDDGEYEEGDDDDDEEEYMEAALPPKCELLKTDSECRW